MVTRAFTLVELLVVITIIVVLLALLAPALDKAVYQAELAVCAGNLKGVGSGVNAYAMAHQRAYPYRPAVYADVGNYFTQHLSLPLGYHNQAEPNGFDDRPMLRPFIPINAMQCPPAGKVDLDGSPATSQVYASYSLWFGWQYTAAGGGRGMKRLGDRIEYRGEGYNVLAGDWLFLVYGVLASSHPDSKDVARPHRKQDEPYSDSAAAGPATVSQWLAGTTWGPGQYDLNFGFDDGSVRRFNRVIPNVGDYKKEPRFDGVPAASDGGASLLGWLAIPNTR